MNIACRPRCLASFAPDENSQRNEGGKINYGTGTGSCPATKQLNLKAVNGLRALTDVYKNKFVKLHAT